MTEKRTLSYQQLNQVAAERVESNLNESEGIEPADSVLKHMNRFHSQLQDFMSYLRSEWDAVDVPGFGEIDLEHIRPEVLPQQSRDGESWIQFPSVCSHPEASNWTPEEIAIQGAKMQLTERFSEMFGEVSGLSEMME